MINNLKNLVLLILLTISLIKPSDVFASSNSSDVFSWMTTGFGELKSLLGCIEVPEFTGFQKGQTALSMASSGDWQPTGNVVQKGKIIKISWSTSSITPEPRKYLVLYRIDPRFNTPQVFIKTYNYATSKFEALDFPGFTSANDGVIPADKDLDALSFTKMQGYVDYFAKSHSKIPVQPGDVVNISLVNKSTFFNPNTEGNILVRELDTNIFAPAALYTESNLGSFENRIIYSSAENICDLIDSTRKGLCEGTGAATKYKSSDNLILVGKPMTAGATQNLMSLMNACSSNSNLQTKPACYYDQGRGMEIKISGKKIKNSDSIFVSSGDNTQSSFIYYKTTTEGAIDFTSDLEFKGMFAKSTLMSGWIDNFPPDSFSNIINSNYQRFTNYINNTDWSAKFLYFGRYTMIVEVGNGTQTVNANDMQNVKVEYLITPDGTLPAPSDSGTEISQDFSGDAQQNGYLWLRVVNPNKNVQGMINVNYANYTGTTWFSDIIYNGAIKPITDEFRNLTGDLYNGLAQYSSVQNIIKASLTLYITIFGLMFVMGTLKLTAVEVITRIFKISMVAFLLQSDSWNFFNKYLFSAFLDGIDFFATNVVGVTSSKNNIFGFIDPIFDKYTNGGIWGLLFIQLLQIQNGLVVVAIITIYSLITYFRAILEVITGYLIAFIAMTVMISLAPFFIIFMLFEQTKSLFDNWLSTIFSYVIQPTVLLIFFLFIDQIISEQLLKIIVRACWGTLIPIQIGLDLNHLGINFSFSFTLPFFPGIPFFIPDVPVIDSANLLTNNPSTFLVIFSTTLLFASYCLMARGLVSFVTIVVSMLTNVTPARIEGQYQERQDPTGSIMHDIKSVTTKPITNAVKIPARIFKDKFIDQNYKAKVDEGGRKEYTNKLRSERNDVPPTEEK